jgi:signal transduction histidine kinase/CheY-like chemotaxis protein
VIADILTRLESGQSISDYEARLRCKDGSTKHVLINSNVYFSEGKFVHTRCFTRDVTARKQAEERLHFMADASAVLASSLDYDATLAAVAKLAVPRLADLAIVDMLANGELKRLAVEHADPTKLEAARALPVQPRIWNTVRTGRSEHLAELTPEALVAAFPADGARTVASSLGLKSVISAPLTARGQVVGAITLAFAESGRKYGDEDVRLVQQLAERASVAIENAIHYKAAEEASLAKDEFLAVVSHELRTPLNAILGWVHLLRENAVPPEAQSRELETFERNGRAQNLLIEDLLDVRRIVSGKLRLDVGSVDLPLVVERAIETVRPAADAKGVTILATLDPRATPVMGDADRLQQVVWNLLSNAVKFSAKGGAVQVVLRKSESNLELLVQDRGQGIPPGFLPHVFERFRQADNRSTRVKGGLGLGLAIARNLVELHGGSIRAESEGVGHGALFAVCLPISPLRAASFERPPALQLMAVAPSVACPPELEGLDILVVDDEADARELLAALLVRCKARPITASSVAEAIRLVREKRPAIVISDIGMPEEDGYALIKKLRRLGVAEGGQTPAVALTAYARTEERTKALVSGFSMHVPKPVEPSELLAVLASLATGFKRDHSPSERP